MHAALQIRANRRGFLATIALGLGALAIGCERQSIADDATPLPTASPPGRTWQWEIRWIGATPARPPEEGEGTWALVLDGQVVAPRRMTLAALRSLPAVEQRSRMKCVECWSAPAVWRGIRGPELLSLVERLPGADYITFHAADGYESTLSVHDFADRRTLLAYEMDGEPMPVEHGFPLRLVLPAHYGYKGVKAVTRLEFTGEHKKGYWESRGYDNEGIIVPGRDRPLDLGGIREIGFGEITEY